MTAMSFAICMGCRWPPRSPARRPLEAGGRELGSGRGACAGGGSLRFLQLFRAFVAADFDDLAADLHLDGVVVELVVAGRAGSFAHDRSPVIPVLSGCAQ